MKRAIAALILTLALPCISAAQPRQAAAAAPKAEFRPIEIADTRTVREDMPEPEEAAQIVETTASEAQGIETAGGRTLTVMATAYCPTGNLTATGTVPTQGRTIAVDPSVIPLGTHVLISGTEYIAEDTGGLIKGNRIDIFLDSYDEAVSFGAQYIEIEVLL